MGHFLAAVGVFNGEIESSLVYAFGIHAPALERVGFCLLQLNKFSQVIIIEWVGFAHVAAGVKLIVPDFARRRTLLEEQHHGLDARALKRAAGAVEHGVEVAAFQQVLAEADGGVVGVTQECVLDDDAGAATGFENFDVMLEEEVGGLAGADGEVLLHFLAFLAAEGRIGLDDVVPVFFLNVGYVFGESVDVDDVWRFDAMQDHIHNADDVGQRLLFLAVERAGLEETILRDGAIGIGFLQVVERLAVEARRARRAIVDAFAEFRLHDLNNGTDKRTNGVILAAVPTCVSHVFDFGFVEVGQFVFLGLRTEAQFVDVVNDLSQVITALDFVLNFAEDFADFVFDGVRAGRLGLEAVQIGEELLIDEDQQVIAGHGGIVIELVVFALRRGPSIPTIGFVEDEGVFLPIELGFRDLVVLQIINVFQKQ